MKRKKRAAYSRWLKGFFVILIGFLVLVAAFNLLVDGVGIFRIDAGLKYVVSSLLNGKMVAGRMSYDERELQRLIVEQYPGRRDVIVIGSSRTMILRKKFIGGNPDFFNHSVSGAVVEDFPAIIGLYKEKGTLPKTVILGIDPWMFNRNNGLGKAARTLDKWRREMTEEIEGGSPGGKGTGGTGTDGSTGKNMFSRYMQLINLDYTVQNWELLRTGKKLRITDTLDVDDFVREPDGSIHFPSIVRGMRMVKDGPSNAMPDMYFKDFKSLDATEQFEGLVRYLQAHGVRVVFLLPPFHGAAYRSCFTNPKYGVVPQIETYLRNFAARKGITVIGSYDPARYGFTGEDFFDGTHGHDIVMKRLFEEFR